MSLDQRAHILNTVKSAPCGVRELIQKLRWRNSHVISLLEKMKDERLIELQSSHTQERGRPKKNIACTPLGLAFLETHKKLQIQPLRARKEDLEHAVKDALYAERLAANGHSPFRLFMELNTIAHNIKVSSEAP
jgi:DNA-binding PadR family transcriptional regulator